MIYKHTAVLSCIVTKWLAFGHPLSPSFPNCCANRPRLKGQRCEANSGSEAEKVGPNNAVFIQPFSLPGKS